MKCLETRGKKVQHPGQEDHRVDAPLGRVLQGGVQEEEVQRWTTTLYICQLYNLSPPHVISVCILLETCKSK